MKNLFLITIVLLLSSQHSFAARYVATFVHAKGDVKVFHAKMKKGKKYRTVLYEGKAHSYQKARVGLKVRANDIVHCGPDAKAKIVYATGDHFVIGPGSSIKLPLVDTKKKNPTLDMYYGKLRSLISKGGPLQKLRVKTKAAVAGVRGTDFFISDDGVNKTEITVLRGKVNVAASDKVGKKGKKKTESAIVESGYKVKLLKKIETKKSLPSALPRKGQVAKEKMIEKTESMALRVFKAPKQDLIKVQKASLVVVKPNEIKVSEKSKAAIVKLEKKAAQAVLEDIKVEDKALYEKLKKEKVEDISEINTAVVSKLFKAAPIAKKKLKATEDEIEDLGGDDIYRKYFNVE